MQASVQKSKLQHDPLHEIRIESQSWSQKEWEKHLSKLETSLSESLISKNQYLKLSETNNISGHFRSGNYNQEHRYRINIKRARKTLTKREDKIIELYFYEDLVVVDIATKLKLNKFSVYTYKRRALAKIKKSLLSQSDFFLPNLK